MVLPWIQVDWRDFSWQGWRWLVAELFCQRSYLVRGINGGRLLDTAAPTADASLAIATLAYNLTAGQMESEEIARPSELLTTVHKLMEK